MHGRIFLDKDKKKLPTLWYSPDRVRADHSDSLRERYAMWKNVDLEAWYRSRFIGFTDLSRSDTGFGTRCLAGSIDKR